MADKDFFVDGDFGQLAIDLLAEFGVPAQIHRNTVATDPNDPRKKVNTPVAPISIDLIPADAVKTLGMPDDIASSSDSVFFSGKGLTITPDVTKDTIYVKDQTGAFTDKLKVTKYKPVLRGLENVILWEAQIGSGV